METVQVKVRKATPEDFKEVVRYNSSNKPVMGLRLGLPYLLKSKNTGNWEGWYITDGTTDPKDIADWLKNEMIYIAPKEFKK